MALWSAGACSRFPRRSRLTKIGASLWAQAGAAALGFGVRELAPAFMTAETRLALRSKSCQRNRI
jgi:hypothetical protein